MNTPSQSHFIFAEEICKQDPNLYMASLDVDSLFTNILLDKTIDSLYKDDENTPKTPKDVFRHLLPMATKESFFMFNNKFYKQIDGVAMGSPLGSALANIFMCNFENKWLKDCPHNLKPFFYRQYVHDIFVLFSSLDQSEKFKKYLSSKQGSKFSSYKIELRNRVVQSDVTLRVTNSNIFIESLLLSC